MMIRKKQKPPPKKKIRRLCNKPKPDGSTCKKNKGHWGKC